MDSRKLAVALFSLLQGCKQAHLKSYCPEIDDVLATTKFMNPWHKLHHIKNVMNHFKNIHDKAG